MHTFVLYCCITMDPQPVEVQRPITSSLCEFSGYWDLLRYPGLPPVLVSIAFSPASSISRYFPFTLPLPLDFISVSSLRLTYVSALVRSTLHILPFEVSFQIWDWPWYPMLGSQRRIRGVHDAEISFQISALAGV